MSALSTARHLWRQPEFTRGAREMVGVGLGIAAWGLVTGVAMRKSGLSVPLSCLMSLIVFAGSAQLAALPLIVAGAPIWMVWAIAFCVNLRFVIFSAQWRPYFAHFPRWQRMVLGYFTADLNYVVFMGRYPEPKALPEQLPYYWGLALTGWLAWQIPTFIGLAMADRIPTAWGFGFAGVLALLGLLYSLVNDRASIVAGVVAGAAAVATAALPLKLNIVVAIVAAIGAGLAVERIVAPRRLARREVS